MEIATVIGVPPAVSSPPFSKVPAGVDKLSVAGGSRETLWRRQGPDHGPGYPGHGEIVIEGYIDPRDKEETATRRIERYYMAFEKARPSMSPASGIEKALCTTRCPLGP